MTTPLRPPPLGRMQRGTDHMAGLVQALLPGAVGFALLGVVIAFALASLGVGRPAPAELVARANDALRAGAFPEAALWAQRAVQAAPAHLGARMCLLEASAALGRTAAVAELLGSLAPTDRPVHAPAHLLRARWQLASDDASLTALDEAARSIDRALEAAARDADPRIAEPARALRAAVHGRRASLHRHGANRDPKRWSREVIAGLIEAPDDLALTDELIAGFHDWRFLPGFIENLDARLRSAGLTGPACLLGGIDALLLGRPETAYARFRQAHDDSPGNPVVANNVAAILGTRGVDADPQAALTVIDTVLARHPQQPAFLDTRGRILLRLGRPAEAVATFDQLLHLRPGDPATHHALAEAWARLGNPARAEFHRRSATSP